MSLAKRKQPTFHGDEPDTLSWFQTRPAARSRGRNGGLPRKSECRREGDGTRRGLAERKREVPGKKSSNLRLRMQEISEDRN
jgi:hypothetical protein